MLKREESGELHLCGFHKMVKALQDIDHIGLKMTVTPTWQTDVDQKPVESKRFIV